MRRIIAVLLTSTLVLAGCSSGGTPLDDVKVTGSAANPSLVIPAKFSVEQSTTKVVKAGTGSKVGDGDFVKVDFAGYVGRTGNQFENSFAGGTPLSVELTEGKSLPGFIKALSGQRVGARLVTAIAPVDGFAAERPEMGLLKSDTMVFYLHLTSKLPTEPTGTKRSLPATVPTVKLKEGVPVGFQKTAGTPATLSAPSAHLLIEGKGKKVPAGSSVTAHYLGQVYPQGEVFDSSYSRGAPTSFPLTGVIKCWSDLLPGVPVGSRVVLECPSDVAYGQNPPQGSAIKAGDSLLFVVDVLDAN